MARVDAEDVYIDITSLIVEFEDDAREQCVVIKRRLSETLGFISICAGGFGWIMVDSGGWNWWDLAGFGWI